MQLNNLIDTSGLVAGIDEAGRGPLAGPVVAAAVILAPGQDTQHYKDSKALSAGRRERLAEDIRTHSLAWSIAVASRAEIDSFNILQATMLAMRRAIIGLKVLPSAVQVDGNRLPDLDIDGTRIPGAAIVGGDGKIAAISAASILAKTARDEMMLAIDSRYPGYGFAQHKGYGTAQHREQLQALGPCPEHRHSFAPVRKLL
tara:strand:- start:649 stop:1251 length:603 start_codon:yes stop_codon:yes gene_type:complete